jgi:hypothetical protein
MRVGQVQNAKEKNSTEKPPQRRGFWKEEKSTERSFLAERENSREGRNYQIGENTRE